MYVELLWPARRIEAGDCLLQRFPIDAQLRGKLANRVTSFRWHITEQRVLHAGNRESLGVGNPIRLLVLIAPDLEADVLERIVPGVTTLVEEAFGVAVDEDACGETVDRCIRRRRACVHDLCVDHVEL